MSVAHILCVSWGIIEGVRVTWEPYQSRDDPLWTLFCHRLGTDGWIFGAKTNMDAFVVFLDVRRASYLPTVCRSF